MGCELEKTDSELIDGHCELHPKLDIEFIEEENYFFKFSAFKERLLALYKENPDFIVPHSRGNEIRAFIERGPEDFSISRLKEKMPWGVPVPGDATQVIYVWFDALINYISTLGWPDDKEKFESFWGTEKEPNAIQMAGKDNIRQQGAMWQAMLMAADLPHSKQIVIHGFIQSGGEKMSKSTGNVIDPLPIVDEYGTDALRYYLARHVHPFEDSDFTMEKFKEAYNADLVNGLGNVVARVMKLAETYLENPIDKPNFGEDLRVAHGQHLDRFEINHYLENIWREIQTIDKQINETEPFKVVKENPEKGKDIIKTKVEELYLIAHYLEPILPTTSRVIKETILLNKKPQNLFPRKD
mgnify:CR=1 FL=1